MKSKPKFALFWIKSGRGTDEKTCVLLPNFVTKEEIEERLEQWCSGFGCWKMSESVMSYGYKIVTMPPRKELMKMYDKACKAKRKTHEKWQVLVAMLNPR